LFLTNQVSESKSFLFARKDGMFGSAIFFIINDTDSLLKWIQANSTRIFNLSEKPKHGTNGKGGHPESRGNPVSKLLCNKEEAQDLLNMAIPDFSVQENRLYNFDKKHKSFIEFRDENALNQWHGFHVEENRVPQTIRKHFGKN
jgi:hypothetical protein